MTFNNYLDLEEHFLSDWAHQPKHMFEQRPRLSYSSLCQKCGKKLARCERVNIINMTAQVKFHNTPLENFTTRVTLCDACIAPMTSYSWRFDAEPGERFRCTSGINPDLNLQAFDLNCHHCDRPIRIIRSGSTHPTRQRHYCGLKCERKAVNKAPDRMH